jgi:hypothetical protein
LSPAETFHVFRIVGEILGQAFHRTGQIPGEVVSRAPGSVVPKVPYQKISLTLPLSKPGLQATQAA